MIFTHYFRHEKYFQVTINEIKNSGGTFFLSFFLVEMVEQFAIMGVIGLIRVWEMIRKPRGTEQREDFA